jgi:hypothetical protein
MPKKRHDKPHPIITAPMVLLIVGITGPRPIVARESGGVGGGRAEDKGHRSSTRDVEKKKGSSVRDQEHGIKCKTCPVLYVPLAPVG